MSLDVRISARADYAIRAVVELADAGDRPVSSEAIATRQDIPRPFLIKILTELRQAGLIMSVRGSEGGHLLARAPEEITIADVLEAIDGPLADIHGTNPADSTYLGAAQALSTVWIALEANIQAVLGAVSLADVVRGEIPDQVTAVAKGFTSTI